MDCYHPHGSGISIHLRDVGQGAEEGRRPPTQYVPTLFTRLFTGCLYQPLDSIEEYYGEKIAFFFAWLPARVVPSDFPLRLWVDRVYLSNRLR